MEIRRLPTQEERVETGPVSFGLELGFFIASEDAYATRLAIANIMVNHQDPRARMQLQALASMLEECYAIKEKRNG